MHSGLNLYFLLQEQKVKRESLDPSLMPFAKENGDSQICVHPHQYGEFIQLLGKQSQVQKAS